MDVRRTTPAEDSGDDLFAGGGALVLAALASGLIYLTIGDGRVTRYAWLVILLALIAGMKILPAGVATRVTALCYPLGVALWGLVAVLFTLAPGALAYTFSRFVVESFPRWLQVVTLVAWVILLAGVSVLLYSRALRERLRAWLANHPVLRAFTWPERVEAWAAIALYINFVVVAMGCFAGLAFLLHGLTPPLFLPRARPVEHGSLADFLLWHLLDAIPGIKVPETIKWEAPLAYERSGAGWLLLLFKLMVIVPVVSGVGHYLKEEREGPSAGARDAG